MAEEVRDQAAVKENGGDVVADRVYTCKFCNKNFDTYQAYGGHQNAHRRERALMRRLQRDAVLLDTPPPQLPFPPLTPATRQQVFMFPQPPHQPLFRSPHYVPPYPSHSPLIPQPQYFPASPNPFQPSFQPFLHPFRPANSTFPSSFSHVAANASHMRAPYQFGGEMRREEDRRKNMHYEFGPMLKAGAPGGEATMARPPSFYFGSRGSNSGGGRGELVPDDKENELELDLTLHL